MYIFDLKRIYRNEVGLTRFVSVNVDVPAQPFIRVADGDLRSALERAVVVTQGSLRMAVAEVWPSPAVIPFRAVVEFKAEVKLRCLPDFRGDHACCFEHSDLFNVNLDNVAHGWFSSTVDELSIWERKDIPEDVRVYLARIMGPECPINLN